MINNYNLICWTKFKLFCKGDITTKDNYENIIGTKF